MVTITLAGSGTKLEEEHRALDRALRRTPQRVTTFHAERHDPRAVATVRELWRARMASEHRSTTVFSELCAQLVEANATLDCQTTMLRMAADELRHTETCGEIVRALGGDASCTVDVSPTRLPLHRGCSIEERAMRNVIYTTCLSEMIAVARLADEVEQTRDPFLRDASRRILADEVLHGQFGFHYLRAWSVWIEKNRAIRRSLERYLQHAFAVLERELRPKRGARPSEDERALGVADPDRVRAIFDDTVRGAIVPGLQSFGIDAERAWRRRRHTL